MKRQAASDRPPGPPGRPLAGVGLDFRSDPLGLLTKAAGYGDVASLRVGKRYAYLLNHPDLVEHVLVKNHRNFRKGLALQATRRVLGNGLLTNNEYESHMRQRRLIQPAFHRRRIAAFGQIMIDFTQQQIANWRSGEQRDLHQEMMALTMGIVAMSLFSTDVRDEADKLGAALGNLREDFALVDASPVGGLLQKLPTPRQRRLERHIQTLDEAIFRMIDERRASNEDTGDLLSMLLQAVDVEGDGAGMSNQQARDEVITLFVAGHETTANALCWTFYLLAQHPEAEARLHAELEAVLGGHPPSLEDRPQLAYNRMVFAESMRLYPPAWAIGRTAVEQDEIGGYTVPAETAVIMSPYVIHRRPDFWDKPTEFRPERFEPESGTSRPRYAYFPFGGGPRLCIGEPFAWMEGELLLAAIAQRFRLTVAPEALIEPDALVTLRPKAGMPMIIHERTR